MKHAYVSILSVSSGLLACSFAATAQVSIEWDKTLGGKGSEILEAVTTAHDGGYLLAGYSTSNASGDKTEDNEGKADYWIVKIDAQGNKLWDKSFGGENVEHLNDVVPTPDGGYLLAGRSYSKGIGDYIGDEYGDCDDPYREYYFNCYNSNFWIIKIDADGNKQWDKIFGNSNSSEELGSIIASPEGGFLIAGTSSFNREYISNYGYWIIKIDEHGNQEWEKNFGGGYIDYLRSAVATDDGGYLLAGYSASKASGDKSENNKGNEDYWIVKIDSEGNKQWDKTFGTDKTDELTRAIATNDGGFLLAGSSYDKGDYDRYFSDYWIVKIDSEGNKQWDKTFGTETLVDDDIYEDDYLTGLVETDKGYLLGGESSLNYWIVEIDTEGNRLWDRKFHGSSAKLTDLTSTIDGGYLLAGWSDSNASKDKTEDSRGYYDYWIIKLVETEEDFSIKSLAFINAETDTQIQEIKEGDIIDLATLSSTKFSIVANTEPETVGSVSFRLEGPFIHGHTENYAPYALFGDNPAGDFSGRLLPPGEYTLIATPYAGKSKEGTAGRALEISFTIINSEEINDAQVTGFTLYDVVKDQKIMDLTDGSVIHTDELNHDQLTILVLTMPDFVGSVKVELWGAMSHMRIENTKPYTLFRNNSKDLFGSAFPAGAYHLKATPYTEANAQGVAGLPLQISFTVHAAESSSTRVAVYPVPTKGVVYINPEGGVGGTQMMLQDDKGNVLLSRILSSQSVEQLDLNSYKKGIYFLKFISQGVVHVKRVVVE